MKQLKTYSQPLIDAGLKSTATPSTIKNLNDKKLLSPSASQSKMSFVLQEMSKQQISGNIKIPEIKWIKNAMFYSIETIVWMDGAVTTEIYTHIQ